MLFRSVMLLIKRVGVISHILLSITGAVSHNVAQLLVAGVVLQSQYTIYYLPVMILSGVLTGIATGILLKLLAPYLQNLQQALE